jgi:hypothetical protein
MSYGLSQFLPDSTFPEKEKTISELIGCPDPQPKK